MRIGIVGDIHEPFSHPMYRRFCEDIFDQWDVNHVHMIGDIVDNHDISFHESSAENIGAKSELFKAKANVAIWHKSFPKATVSIGNHDALHFRRARREGLPDFFLKDYKDVWGTPSWEWKLHHVFDGIRYQHGTNTSGKNAALNQAVNRRKSVVQGHTHCYAGVTWHTNDDNRIFGLNVGCGIDINAYAFEYAKDFPIRPVLGCGVVIDGHPYFESMQCGPGEPYHRSRA